MIARSMTIVAACAVSGLAGEFTLVTDDREVVAQGSCSDLSGYDFSSEDLLPKTPFEEWSVFAIGAGFVESTTGYGEASQESTITPTALTATGDSYVQVDTSYEGFALGFAYSRYSVGFSVSEPTRVRVQAELYGSGSAGSWVRIEDATASDVYYADGFGFPPPVDDTLTLPAGDYRFELYSDADVYLDSGPGGDGADSFYQGSLTIADGCNAADQAAPFGILDLSDLTAFIAAFTGGSANADLATPAGVLDLADLTAFIGLFIGGCPG